MNGKVEMEDKSGLPREKDELEEALKAVEWTMVKQMLKIPPRLLVMLPTIRDVLREAIVLRGVTEGKQVGWYELRSRTFCHMDARRSAEGRALYKDYIIPVYVLT